MASPQDADEKNLSSLAKRMLNMPPKHRDAAKVGGGRVRGAAAGKYKPSEPMIVYDIARLRSGKVRVSKPYLLNPDGSVAALTASSK